MKHTRPLIVICLLLVAFFAVWHWVARPANPAPSPAGQSVAVTDKTTAPEEAVQPAATAPEQQPAPASAAVSPWKLTGKVSDVPALRQAKGPAMEIDTAAARNAWAGLKKGDTLDIDLGADGHVRARVNLVTGENGVTQIEGSLLEQERGSFFLGFKDAAISGAVQLPAKKQAYLISTHANNLSDIQAVPLNTVICDPLPRSSQRSEGTGAPGSADRPIPQLESRPGAQAVLFLNFNGTPGVYPRWNEGLSIAIQPSNLSEEDIAYVWKSVSEDYRSFNVNITTIRQRYDSASKNRRMECIITPTDTAEPGAGGVAYLHSFYWGNGTESHNDLNRDTCCWVFNTTADGVAEAASHELGHTLGLSHDASGGASPGDNVYYAGHEDGSWGPIMGSSYKMRVTQWSKGEYADANNTEDDISIIATGSGNASATPWGANVNGVGFAADGVGNNRFSATSLSLTSGSTFGQSSGILLGDTNSKMYRVTLPGDAPFYAVSFHAKPAETRPNVKLGLELQPFVYGQSAIATGGESDSSSLEARIDSLVLEGGATYYLQVKGIAYNGADGNIAASGFTAYGSAGEYTLEGSFYPYSKAVELQRLPTNTEGVLDFDVALVAVVNAYPKAQIEWKMSPDGGVTWLPLSSGANSYGGSYEILEDGARLVISGLTEAMTAYQYQCTATNTVDGMTYSANSTTTLRVIKSLVPSPVSLERDSTGALYAADNKLHAIRKIAPSTLYVSTYAGTVETPGLANGAGDKARFNNPGGIAITAARNLYVADSGNNQIRLVTSGTAPSVTTLAGSSTAGLGNGDGAAARFTNPGDVAVAPNGNVYVADTENHSIRLITDGVVSTLFGNAADPGWADGDALTARLDNPSGIAVTDTGDVYVADTGNHVIRMISNGTLTTVAGLPGQAAFSDGAEFNARFNRPMGLTAKSGTLFVADTGNSAIRTLVSDSTGLHEAGTLAGDSLDPTRQDGPAASARFKYPQDIIAGADGNLYVADTGNAAIRKIEPANGNRVSTLVLK
ncbi:MAG: M12 family metallo-peptidase, partial [Opitutaceae bacterium]|nr:M12 family metallo-peptidase [Opitutaceae bacterium]